MRSGDPRVWIWLAVAALCGLVVVPLWKPLDRAWSCYARYADAPEVTAVFVERLPGELSLFRMQDGEAAGQGCTVRASYWDPPAPEPGQPLRVVHSEQMPGECVPVPTVENSRLALWAITGLVGLILLPVLLLGIFLHRGIGRVAEPQRHLDADPGGVLCPACGAKMHEGRVVLMAGVHWREPGQAQGLPTALGGLPGTVGWNRRAVLHAFRCEGCEVLTVQYGRPDRSLPPR